MSGQFQFRELLLKIQDLLSDHDRQRLHFLLGDDIPRHLRDDPSLGGTLSVLQSLFDKDIINDQDCDYLITALTKIRCLDAARRLQDYQQNQQQNETTSLSLINILARDVEDDDKVMTRHLSREKPAEVQVKQESFEIELPPTSSSWIKMFVKTKLTFREYLLVVLIFLSLVGLILAIRPWKKSQTDFPPKVDSLTRQMRFNPRWSSNGTTILGKSRLNYPRGIAVRKDGTIYVADFNNHRIIEQHSNQSIGRIFSVDGSNRLNQPTDVLIEKNDETLIICDYGNRRLMRWSLMTDRTEEMSISGDDCRGLAMDNRGNLYVSDGNKHEIRRYRIGEQTGTIVAGGNGQDNGLNQFSYPLYIAVDDEYSIYVSDTDNARVMKWQKNAKEGVVVAGANGVGNKLDQLNHPLGIYVDPWKNIYIVDSANGRVMRWREGNSEGEIIVGNIGLVYPVGLGFDSNWNLYLVDGSNHRVLKFDLLSSK